MLIFVLTLFVICISASDNVRLRIIVNPHLVLDLYSYANVFFRVCVSKHGCSSVGTNPCINALALIRVIVFI